MVREMRDQLYFIFKKNFFLKISAELTAANPPLFAEEDWPWANICAHFPLLLYVGRLPQHGLPCGAMSAPGIRIGEPWATKKQNVQT